MKDDKVKTLKISELRLQSKIHEALYPEYIELRKRQLNAQTNYKMANMPETKELFREYYDLACVEIAGYLSAFQKALEAAGVKNSLRFITSLDRPREWIRLEEKDVVGNSSSKVVFIADRRA